MKRLYQCNTLLDINRCNKNEGVPTTQDMVRHCEEGEARRSNLTSAFHKEFPIGLLLSARNAENLCY